MATWSGSGQNVSYSEWLLRSMWDERRDDASGSAGVREPRNPIRPRNTTGTALDIPHAELRAAIERGRILAKRYGW